MVGAFAAIAVLWSTAAFARGDGHVERLTGPSAEIHATSPASVDGAPLSVVEIQEFMEARTGQLGAAPLPSVQQAALDRAIRSRLFAAEAIRRGIRAPTKGSDALRRAYLSQALIQAELDRLGIRLEAVDDAQALADVEARAYFEAHRAQDASPGFGGRSSDRRRRSGKC